MSPKIQVIVHGGAISDPSDPERRQDVLTRAAETGSRSETPIDAVEESIGVLESSPRFNAGIGSAVQADGVIRTDAGIMTDDRTVGAACSMSGIEHAISVARLVAEETPHGLISGEHAVELADAYGIETDVDLWTDRTRERYDQEDVPVANPGDQLDWIRERFGTNTDDVPGEKDHDTVGAVAFDGERLAAATSTGGRWLALAGRVGDVPQVGSGFYCNSAAGVSATGAGEDIARTTLSRRVARHIERGSDPTEATTLAIEEFGEITGSSAGVIAIDSQGRIGSAYNSDGMQTARAMR